GGIYKSALFQNGIFLIRDRDRARQAYSRAVFRANIQLPPRVAGGVSRDPSPPEGGGVQHRPTLAEAALLVRIGGSAVEHGAPGEARRTSRDDLIEGVRNHIQSAGQIVERVLVHARADQPIVERSRQAAQIGILRQRLDQRLGFAELLGESYHLLSGQKQQPVLREKRPSTRLQNGVEMNLLRSQFLDQRRRDLRRQFRGWSIDDRQDGFFFGRKRFFERHLSLPPWQFL